jgi:hypothetical protein
MLPIGVLSTMLNDQDAACRVMDSPQQICRAANMVQRLKDTDNFNDPLRPH